MRSSFFKYYTNESLKLTLIHGTRKWSSPAIFNDPFDNKIDIQWAWNHIDFEKKMLESLCRLAKIKNPDLSTWPQEMKLLISEINKVPKKQQDNFFKQLSTPTGLYSDKSYKEKFDKLNNDIKSVLSDTSIFCVSECNDNILMWTHYTNNHKGGVIQFLPIKEIDSPLLVAKKVNYSKKFPYIDPFDMYGNQTILRQKIIDAITLTKSEVWKYEKEWRVVYALRNTKNEYDFLPFSPKEVGAIFLGCRISNIDRQEIIDIANTKYPLASIFQAHTKKDEFSLAFEKIK